MNEIILDLEQISPKEFFGPQNKNIELLKRYFPKLKIVARGNKITAFGDEDLLEEFDKRMEMLFSHFTAYNNLDENMIERILTSDSKDDYTTSNESGKVLLHGVNGRLIKAQTTNQAYFIDSKGVFKTSRSHDYFFKNFGVESLTPTQIHVSVVSFSFSKYSMSVWRQCVHIYTIYLKRSKQLVSN